MSALKFIYNIVAEVKKEVDSQQIEKEREAVRGQMFETVLGRPCTTECRTITCEVGGQKIRFTDEEDDTLSLYLYNNTLLTPEKLKSIFDILDQK